MHRARLLAFLLLGTPVLAAQDAAPTPEEQLRSKLASPFLTHAPWLTDYDAARARARADGRLILGYFTTAGY